MAHAGVTGAWTLDAGYSYHLDRSLAFAIAEILRSAASAVSILDVGAGTGRYVHYLQRAGLNASGIDGATGIETLTAGRVRHQASLVWLYISAALLHLISSLALGRTLLKPFARLTNGSCVWRSSGIDDPPHYCQVPMAVCHPRRWPSMSRLRARARCWTPSTAPHDRCTQDAADAAPHFETAQSLTAAMSRQGLIMSWARPYQKGNGHVNPLVRSEVIARLAPYGFVLRPFQSVQLASRYSMPPDTSGASGDRSHSC